MNGPVLKGMILSFGRIESQASNETAYEREVEYNQKREKPRRNEDGQYYGFTSVGQKTPSTRRL